LIIRLHCVVGHFDLMIKIRKRGRPRIRTAEYWREYYARKQREWRAAHLPIRTGRTQKQRRANDRRAASRWLSRNNRLGMLGMPGWL